MANNNQKGFSAVEILLVILVVGILVLAGWLFYNRQKEDNADTAQTTQQTEQTAPQVNSADDLKNAEDYLNQSDIDQQLDTGEIDAALSEQ